MGWRPRTRGSLEPRHGTSMKVDAPLALNEQSYQPKQVVKQFAPKNKVVKQGARARAPLHTGPLSNTTTWRALFRSLERLLRFVGKVHSVAWACYLELVYGETSLLADKVLDVSLFNILYVKSSLTVSNTPARLPEALLRTPD